MRKKAVYDAVIEHIESRIRMLESEMRDLADERSQNAKSSSGDKHETGSAMTHLELEKLGGQLDGEKQKRALLDRVDPNATLDQIGLGSLIETNRGWFFIAVAIGKVSVEDQPVFCISAQSPLGADLLAKSEPTEVRMNDVNYQILSFS